MSDIQRLKAQLYRPMTEGQQGLAASRAAIGLALFWPSSVGQHTGSVPQLGGLAGPQVDL